MSTQDFTTTLLVDQTPNEVFDAVNNVRGWWSEEIEGDTYKLNAVFNYHFEDIHRCQMKIIEIIPGKKVVWLVMDNYFKPGIFDDPSQQVNKNYAATNYQGEWIGTKISFDIVEKNRKTQLRFTHLGLVPDYDCFDACSSGWTHYIRQSLLGLITKGKGEPNSTGKPMTTAEEKIKSEAG